MHGSANACKARQQVDTSHLHVLERPKGCTHLIMHTAPASASKRYPDLVNGPLLSGCEQLYSNAEQIYVPNDRSYLYASELHKVCIQRVACPCRHDCLLPDTAQLPILQDQERNLVLSLPQHFPCHTACLNSQGHCMHVSSIQAKFATDFDRHWSEFAGIDVRMY